MDFRDDKHCINTSGGHTEITVLVCRIYMPVIDGNLIFKHAIYILLRYKDLVAFVEDCDGLRTGQAVSCSTVVVVNHNTEVIFGRDLFHQPVGTVALKTIVGSIECDIMGIPPPVADTLTFIVGAASIIIQHLNCSKVICTDYRLLSRARSGAQGHAAI